MIENFSPIPGVQNSVYTMMTALRKKKLTKTLVHKVDLSRQLINFLMERLKLEMVKYNLSYLNRLTRAEKRNSMIVNYPIRLRLSTRSMDRIRTN